MGGIKMAQLKVAIVLVLKVKGDVWWWRGHQGSQETGSDNTSMSSTVS